MKTLSTNARLLGVIVVLLVTLTACGRRIKLAAASDSPILVGCVPKTENGAAVGEACSTFWPVNEEGNVVIVTPTPTPTPTGLLPNLPVLEAEPIPWIPTPTPLPTPPPVVARFYERGLSGNCQECLQTTVGINCVDAPETFCPPLVAPTPSATPQTIDSGAAPTALTEPWNVVIEAAYPATTPVAQTGPCIAVVGGIACSHQAVNLQGDTPKVESYKEKEKNGNYKLKVSYDDGSSVKIVEKDNGKVKMKVVTEDGTTIKTKVKKNGDVKVKIK